MTTDSHISSKNFHSSELPSAPQLLLRMIELCQQDEVHIDELESIVSADTGLSARVLDLASSAAYNQWNDVKSLKRLIVVMGTRTIRSLALTAAVNQFFSEFASSIGELLGKIWFRALFNAMLARELAKLLRYEEPEKAYLCALLIPLGRLLLIKQNQQIYQQLLNSALNDETLELQEEQRFGIKSSELTSQVIDHWHLDTWLSDAARYHSKEQHWVAEAPQLIKLVNLSYRASSIDTPQQNWADELFGLKDELIDSFREKALESALSQSKQLGVDIDPNTLEAPTSLDTETTRINLGKKIRELSLLEGLQDQALGVESFDKLMQLLRNQLSILFGFNRIITFLFNAPEDTLSSIDLPLITGNSQDTLSIRMQHSNSQLHVAATSQQTTLYDPVSRLETDTLIDEQIQRFLATDKTLYLPLSYRQRLFAVIALPADGENVAFNEEKQSLLSVFSQTASRIVNNWLEEQEKQQQETQLQQQAELLHKRKLIHEINNPLTSINNYLEILKARLKDSDDNQRDIQIIQSELERVGALVTQFRDSPEQDSQNTSDSNNLNQVIEQQLQLMKTAWFEAKGINIELNLDTEQPEVKINRNHFKQIFLNLVKNAVEALSDTKAANIIIHTRGSVITQGQKYVELTISDNGPGIQEHLLEQLFSPLKSSKGADHSGLGLSIVYQLITEAEGNISYRKNNSGGAEFLLLFPER